MPSETKQLLHLNIKLNLERFKPLDTYMPSETHTYEVSPDDKNVVLNP